MNAWQPNDMVHGSPRTADKFAEEYDRHGDSYTQDATIESLKQVFNNVQSQVQWVYVSREKHSCFGSRYIRLSQSRSRCAYARSSSIALRASKQGARSRSTLSELDL